MKRILVLIMLVLVNMGCASNKEIPLQSIDGINDKVSMYFGVINQLDNVEIVNDSDYTIMTGYSFTIERKENDSWYLVEPREPMYFVEIGLIIQAHSTYRMSVLPLQYYDLEVGYYRLRKSFYVEDINSEYTNQSFELVANFTFDGNIPTNTLVEPLKESGYVSNDVLFEVLSLDETNNLKLINNSDYYLSPIFLLRLEKYVDNQWLLHSQIDVSNLIGINLETSIQPHTIRYGTLNINALNLESGSYRFRNRFMVFENLNDYVLDQVDVVGVFNIN